MQTKWRKRPMRAFVLLNALPLGVAVGQVVPDDPGFPLQWGLQNDGQLIGKQEGLLGADIRATAAWALHLGTPSVTVAIVGTGVDPHVEFADRLLPGRAFNGDWYDTRDTHGAGTHAAGIVAAAVNNGLGIAGIAPHVWLLPVRVLDGAAGNELQLAEGITWAVDQGAQIVLVPLTFSQGPKQLMDAVQYAVDRDALVIAPVGNAGNNDVLFPAALPGCMAISGTTNRDDLSPQSNFGAGTDLAAPGHDIWSAWRDDGYAFRSGAAPASAFVAGVAALVRSFNPGLTQAEVRQILVDATDDLGPEGPDLYFGAGRLNAQHALEMSPPPPLRFEQVEAPPAHVAPNQAHSFRVRIVGGAEEVTPGSPMLAYRTDGSVFEFAPLEMLDLERFEVNLPPLPCDLSIEYYLLAEGSSGTIVTDPSDAPTEFFQSEAIAATQVFADDFEEDRGWETEFFGESTKGQWVRVAPVGTSAQPAYDRTPNEGTHCFLTGQHLGGGDGTGDVDGGPVVLRSPVIPLDAPDARISYDRWFYWSGVETEDFLTVEASRDGGATWALIERVSGSQNPAWDRHEFRLSEFPELTGQELRLRFRTHDDPNDSLTEAAIDDVLVVGLSCIGNPADLDADGDVDLADYGAWWPCLSGPGVAVKDLCRPADLTGDERVDLADCAVLQVHLTGPSG